MAAEWSDENTRIVTDLFTDQVRAGNRPNTHLTPNAYEEVAKEFKRRTCVDLKHTQLKNKWDKLKIDYNNFKRLKQRETGGGWESGTVTHDGEWWKHAKKDIKGCGKFRKQGLRNEENLRVMFEDITSDGTDHWNPASGLPPPSSAVVANILNVDAIQDVDLDEIEEVSPASSKSGKRLGRFIDDKDKKPKTAQVMQEQITKIGNIAERSQASFESFMKADDAASVSIVMNAVLACGATEGTDEHFIATELFVKRDQREMFLHMREASRFEWLSRKYRIKYGH